MACYQAADSVLGLANACTNRAELLALTDPASAITEASRAIEVQAEIGAHHELGKAYTALAVAHLRRSELDQAEAALRSAFSSLDRAGYRSGRARAEFYLAAVNARRGRIDEAISSFRWAAAELEAADVYPTIILCAARVLDALGAANEEVTSAARKACARIQPLGAFADLDRRAGDFAHDLLGTAAWKPHDLYQEAAVQARSESGFYHHNVKVTTQAGPVIVRVAIPGSDVMDLAIWPEARVLRAIRNSVSHAPRLLYASEYPQFQVHGFIDGELLDAIAPRGTPVPGHVIGDIAEVFGQLHEIPRDNIPPLPRDWPADGKTADFARRLSAVTEHVYERFRGEFGELFTSLGIPASPLAEVLARWPTLHPRPFQLLHTDIHRRNLILAQGRTYFLDWELALWGDPLYDLAVHLHKMGYAPGEHDAMQAAWLAALPAEATEQWEHDLRTYLTHEKVKSAIVDTVRYTKIITAGSSKPGREAELSQKLASKLTAAQATGGTWNMRTSFSPTEVLRLIQDWALRRPV